METMELADHFGNAFAELSSAKWMTMNLDMENEKQ